MSYFSYIAFSKELKAFRLSDVNGREKEFGIYYDTSHYRIDILLFPNLSPEDSNIVILDKKDAHFRGCFKNPFIYELCVNLPPDNSRVNIIKKIGVDMEYKKIAQELERLAHERWTLCKQVLYNFIFQNIILGEFVEIYTEMTDHINFNLGPPESECVIDLRDLLNHEFSKLTNKQKIMITYN